MSQRPTPVLPIAGVSRPDHVRSAWQAAARVGLEPDTIRYYERHGVLPPADRDARGHRTYDAGAVHLIEVLLHLRDTGMPLTHIAEFTQLVASDPAGVAERLGLLQDTALTERLTRPTGTSPLRLAFPA